MLAWLRRRGSKLRLNHDDHETQLRTLAAAELASRAERAGFFEAVMRDQRWGQLAESDRHIAKRRLADHFSGSAPDVVNQLAGAMSVANDAAYLDGEGDGDE